MIPANDNEPYVKDALDELIDEVAEKCDLNADDLNALHACRGDNPLAMDKNARQRWTEAAFEIANNSKIPVPYYHRLLRIGRYPSELNDGPTS